MPRSGQWKFVSNLRHVCVLKIPKQADKNSNMGTQVKSYLFKLKDFVNNKYSMIRLLTSWGNYSILKMADAARCSGLQYCLNYVFSLRFFHTNTRVKNITFQSQYQDHILAQYVYKICKDIWKECTALYGMNQKLSNLKIQCLLIYYRSHIC